MSKKTLTRIWRTPYCKYLENQIHNDNFVILSSNCIGGCLLHDINRQFDSPTINLTIPQFVSFVENWEHYFTCTPKLDESADKPYPVCLLDDLTIHCVHYQNFNSFKDSWNRRRDRLYAKMEKGAEILVIATDAQMNETNSMQRFGDLPYRKVAFTAKNIEQQNILRVPDKMIINDHVGDLTKYADIIGRRYFEKIFDCVKFINGE